LRLAPTAGDLDSDGDIDIMVGDFYGKLYYFENTAGEGNPLVFNNRIYEYADLNVANNAKPALDDINGDGLTDIILGKLNNDMNYVQNIGSAGNPMFSNSLSSPPNQRNLGKIF